MRTAVCVVALVLTSWASAGENWPQFRGPSCDGRSDATGLPATWSEKENIAWKTPVHGRGWSSPVVWGNQVWMTTATEDGHQMYAVAVDRRSGKIVHDLKPWDVPEPMPIHAFNSYASPTPVVEEGRVYVHFGRYGTACLNTTTGQEIWSRRDLLCDHFSGPGSSPILVGNLLVLTFDGMDVQYLVGLDKSTGRTVWKTDRSTDYGDADGDHRKAFSTPLVIQVAGSPQLVSSGAQAAIAYDPGSGKELWKVRCAGFSNAAMPVFADGMVLLDTGFSRAQLWAVRPDGRGDITESHVAWRATQSIPLKPTSVVVDGLVYMAEDRGIASCLELRTGKKVWQERFGGNFSASPVFADGRIYFADEAGTTTVIRPGRKCEVLARNRLDDGCMGSPAVAGKAIFLRTKTHLYRIEL